MTHLRRSSIRIDTTPYSLFLHFEGKEPGHVIDVEKPGYMIKDRTLRAPQAGVSIEKTEKAEVYLGSYEYYWHYL